MSKLNRVFRLLLPTLALALLLIVGARMALAGRSDNAETGYENPIDRTLSSNDEEVAGIESQQSPDNFLANGEGQTDTETPTFFEEEV